MLRPLLGVLLVVALGACSGDDDRSAAATTPPPTSAPVPGLSPDATVPPSDGALPGAPAPAGPTVAGPVVPPVPGTTAAPPPVDPGAPPPAGTEPTLLPPPPEPPATAPPAPVPGSAPVSATVPVGEELTFDDGGKAFRATALSYAAPVAQGGPQPGGGQVWGAVEAQICLDGGDVPPDEDGGPGGVVVAAGSWSLRLADGRRVAAPTTGLETFPRPQFPTEGTDLPVGQCLQGSITYPVPAGAGPVAVVYSGAATTVEWAVGR